MRPGASCWAVLVLRARPRNREIGCCCTGFLRAREFGLCRGSALAGRCRARFYRCSWTREGQVRRCCGLSRRPDLPTRPPDLPTNERVIGRYRSWQRCKHPKTPRLLSEFSNPYRYPPRPESKMLQCLFICSQCSPNSPLIYSMAQDRSNTVLVTLETRMT
jgi:hypothetical protein